VIQRVIHNGNSVVEDNQLKPEDCLITGLPKSVNYVPSTRLSKLLNDKEEPPTWIPNRPLGWYIHLEKFGM
jgi:hypothetical protein